MNQLQLQEVSTEVFIEKYAKDGEVTLDQNRRRVAKALASVENENVREDYEERFYRALDSGFIPAGRISSAAGTNIQATLINCFVTPVADTMREYADDGKPGIMKALAEAAETLRRGGGVGYNFSLLRPRGGFVSGTASRSSGPVSFMSVFDKMCETVESAGARRGAQMGVLNCDHPDIEEFIHAKDKQGQLNNFNISVAVTDAFMEAVEKDLNFELIHKAAPHPDVIAKLDSYYREDGVWVYRTVKARDLWDQIMQSTYDHAEPGILYIDRMNQENNLYYCEDIEATNPCAEQPLPNYGCCDLGSINLTKFILDPFTDRAAFDTEKFIEVVGLGVRMLDNVLDLTYWPLEQQKAQSDSKRRIGLGFTGLGDALVMMRIKYNSPEGLNFAELVSRIMRDAAYEASIRLAIEKGAFPMLDVDKYLDSGFARRLPEHIREGIRKHGIRNSHLLSIAPTGTISLSFADNASNGIEPAFSWTYNRKKRMDDGSSKILPVEDHAWRLYRHLGGDVDNLPSYFVTALEMSADDHMNMLKAVQPFIDTSISKTVNVPADYPYVEFKDLYYNGWKAGLKGLATYRPNNILGAVLSVAEEPKVGDEFPVGALKDLDPLTVKFKSRPAGDLNAITRKMVYYTLEGEKKIYLSVSFMAVDGVHNGEAITIERPIEFFVPAGQQDDSQQWVAATMRLLSQIARSGASVADALADLREVVWDKGLVRYGQIDRPDGSKGTRHHESEVAALAYALQEMLQERGFLDTSFRTVDLKIMSSMKALTMFSNTMTAIKNAIQPVAEIKEGLQVMGGTKCGECGEFAVIKVDGCKKCTSCGAIGACG